ncbi:MAG: class B sortase [Aristaeellaceae bacterium]
MLVLGGVSLICIVKLAGYGMDYAASRQASAALHDAYYATDTPAPADAVTPLPTASPSPSPTPSPASAEQADITPEPAVASTQLEAVAYPDNPYSIKRSKFDKVRRQNSDIVGWLTIDNLLDEAVVQRDNSYYLRRDYLGYHNVNGAIFLEETIDLHTRPYTLTLYGHNMKTGTMFGCLRNYENLNFYRNNPFIRFDTLYEDGQYVIFAVSTISTKVSDWNFLNFYSLYSSVISEREAALKALTGHSVYRGGVDVTVNDQVLLLVTCVDDEDERRIVAARRFREGEDEASLQKKVRMTMKN